MHSPDLTHVQLISATEQAQERLDRHRARLERLYRYHDECPDGDPRKAQVERDIRRALSLKNKSEEAAHHAAEALLAYEDRGLAR